MNALNLYPQQNNCRNALDLSGIWQFQPDPTDTGINSGWASALPQPRHIALPGSWNEQHADLRDYTDAAWYALDTWVPAGWRGQRIAIRVGSANYFARVFVNGVEVGTHEGGHLPFGFDITGHVSWDSANHLAIRVDNSLKPDRLPPGGVGMGGGDGGFLAGFPLTSYDFFPYAGIQRQVWLIGLPPVHIEDVTVTTSFDQSGEDVTGHVQVRVNATLDYYGNGTLLIGGQRAVLAFVNGVAQGSLTIAHAELWGPGHPKLYNLMVMLGDTDRYDLDIGIRTFGVKGDRLLLNGAEIQLKGFGKHEDFAGSGRGLNLPALMKDADLLRWIGANSYRTSHYPYSEEAMQQADRQGILIVDETPAVGLGFHMAADLVNRHHELCLAATAALIARDKNHPSVIAWSIANEPVAGSFFNPEKPGSPISRIGRDFLNSLISLARKLDSTRAVSFAHLQGASPDWLTEVDFISINRYYGWYYLGGRLEAAKTALAQELETLHALHGKPIVISEFGADTLPGHHAQPAEMWSEEYQVEVLRYHLDYADSHPYLAGLHIWNFADFKTSQGILRTASMNFKGVFTRDRKPKMAAHFLRSRWNK